MSVKRQSTRGSPASALRHEMSLIIFTIQMLQGFATTPVASVSYFGLFIAIAVTSIALAVNGRIVSCE